MDGVKERSDKLFKKNLIAFIEKSPHIYDRVRQHQLTSTLVYDEDEQPDINREGTLLFGGRAKEYAEEQINKFIDYPTHIAVQEPKSGYLDRYGNPLLKKVLDRAKASDIKFSGGLPRDDAFFAVIFGIGLGYHIDRLIDMWSPVIVHFIEPDIDQFYHSLRVYPWYKLLQRQSDIGGRVMISFESHPNAVTANIEWVMRHYCPPGLDGTPCFVYADKETANKTVENIIQNAATIIAGLGFLFDECLMLKNTYLNLRTTLSKFFRRTKACDVDTPIFVVGAGPSLDSDIEFIQENAQKAIIISTGSALRSLLINGITPDFHIEIENIHVYSSINELRRSFDLSKICLVVPTSIDHHIIDFFDNILFYYRHSTPAFPLFGLKTENVLTTPGPLVVNASFSFAIDLGGKNIYLLGTDFGSRGNGRDHAKDNVLYTEDAIVGYTRQYGYKVPANFSGDFHASHDFFWGLKAIRETILFHGQGRNFFNCSDGALVDGAKPTRTETLKLQGSVKKKNRDLKRIRKRQNILTADEFDIAWKDDDLRSEINVFADKLLFVFKDIKSFENNRYLVEYMRIAGRDMRPGEAILAADHIPLAISVIFRGTMDIILISIRYYLTRLENEEKVEVFREIVAQELAVAIEKMRSDALDIINNPTQILPKKAGGEWDENDFIQEANYTWGNTSRNTDCPCGSGKRYKHCHGNDA
jgi:hypothetical protein